MKVQKKILLPIYSSIISPSQGYSEVPDYDCNQLEFFSSTTYIYRNSTINTFQSINIFYYPFFGEWEKKHRCVATLRIAVMWVQGIILKYENIIMRFKLNWRRYRGILPSSLICLDFVYFFTDHKPDFPYLTKSFIPQFIT